MSLLNRPRNRKEASKTRADSQVLRAVQPFQEWQFSAIEERLMLANSSCKLPADQEELQRQNIQHHMLRSVIERNYVAPLPTTARDILDIGCGTGLWAQEMALEFPLARVIGCDLVEPRGEAELKPANYRFCKANILQGLPFSADSFDFVHQRALFLSIPAVAWPQVIRDLARLARSGGWVELVEVELEGENSGPAGRQISAWIRSACRKQGIESPQVARLSSLLQASGLHTIITKRYPIPVGDWGGKLGAIMATNAATATRALKPFIVSQLGINPYEYEQMLTAQRQEWERLHSTTVYHAVCGQKK